MRPGVAIGFASVLASFLVGTTAAADVTPTAETTTTAATTTVETSATTTAAATTTAPPSTTTAAATTAPAATTTVAAGTPLVEAPRPASGCEPVGAAAVLLPHERPLVLAPAGASAAYPADGSVVDATGVSVSANCGGRGSAGLSGISLFGGAVTATAAVVDLGTGAASVSGLRVGGQPASLASGPIRLGSWGYLLAPDPSNPNRAALEIDLREEQAGLPAGTLVFLPYARVAVTPPAAAAATTTAQTTTAASTTTAQTTTTAAATAPATTTTAAATGGAQSLRPDASAGPPPKPAKAKHKRRKRWTHEPLTVTPPLGGGPYIFPVTGPDAAFGDTYGAARSDVPGGWHHGDDIFAPLGTPVVAVADGTLNRVGWERIGGWRLWVRDNAGDEFYYAHLSGYSPRALLGGRVHRGEVIGFVGNTGDAFTTESHLHFEIHPRVLLHLGYDGAVDPTTYLNEWQRPQTTVAAPRPVHPRLPLAAAPRYEARTDFRELLEARGLLRHRQASASAAAPAPSQASGRAPLVGSAAAAPAATLRASAAGAHGRTTFWAAVAATALLGAGLLAGEALSRRRSLRAGP